MHWTAFLAYRRFPANAQVMDDIACIQCGYNVRGLMVAARCPECGSEVGNSIFLLAKPVIAARGLRAAGITYLAPFILLLPFLHPEYWAVMVASGVILAACVFRVLAVSDLRFRAALARLPVLGTRLHIWWLATFADLIIALMWLIVMLVIAYTPTLQTPAGNAVMLWTMIAWWLSAIFSASAAGRFGHAIMDMLGFVWTRLEFRVQQIAVVAAAALIPLLLVALRAIASLTIAAVVWGFLAVLMGFVMLATALPLMHAATAAEESAETFDDALDEERIVLVPEARLPRKPEPPPIKVE